MARRQAIDIALDGAGKPEAFSMLAVAPLPDGVKSLLRIVAEGEWRDASTEHAYRSHGPEQVRAASAAFLAAVLFDRRADAYRVLGLAPGAPADDVRDNKRLLLKWLHPDRNPRPEERALLAHVIEAAEAIESGRAHAFKSGRAASAASARTGTAAGKRPAPRATPASRGAPLVRVPQSGTKKSAAARTVSGVLRATKLGAGAVLLALTCLAGWRYVMEEPIAVSIERYSKLAMGLITW